MEIRFAEVVATLILGVIRFAQSESILSCKMNEFPTCPDSNQICNGTTLQCECPAGWERADGQCRRPTPGGGGGDGGAAAAMIVVTVVLIACGAALLIRRYKLIDYVRQRLNTRGNNNAYEDVMISQDVPPLSP